MNEIKNYIHSIDSILSGWNDGHEFINSAFNTFNNFCILELSFMTPFITYSKIEDFILDSIVVYKDNEYYSDIDFIKYYFYNIENLPDNLIDTKLLIKELYIEYVALRLKNSDSMYIYYLKRKVDSKNSYYLTKLMMGAP